MFDPSSVCMHCMNPTVDENGICRVCGANSFDVKNKAHQLECGSILAGTYLVGEALGQGGFGITYLGYDLNLNIKVAIKEYYPEGCVTRDTHTHVSVLTFAGEKEEYFQKGKERFVEEARILARFSADSGVVGVRTFFFENGTAYIVMDFVEGETLKSYAAKSGGKLPSAEVLTLFKPLIKSLIRVHDHNLLHRDISPDNIMIRPDGTLALLDFGAARQFSTVGEHSNTINVKHGFAPEEQYRTRGEQGPWTDVYALCATIYRLTTGVTPTESLDRIINGSELTPPNQLGADFTPEQQSVVMHGLEVRASMRIQNMRILTEELYEGVSRHSGVAEKSTASNRTPKIDAAQAKSEAGESGQSVFKQANQEEQRSAARKSWPLIAVALVAIIAVVGFFAIQAYTKDAAIQNNTTPQAESTDSGSHGLVVLPKTSATVCLGPEPATIDPNANYDTDGMIYITHLYEGLYRPNTNGSFSLGQAKSVNITDNADGTAHVVAILRDDIFWSDGVSVRAQDFVYSWKRLCDPANGYPYGYVGQDFFANGYEVATDIITPDQLSVTARDDKTLEFDIVANFPYLEDVLAFPCMMPLRQDIVEANPEGWPTEVASQVSNGRYALSEFTHENRIVLTVNPTYWDVASTKLGTLNCMLSDDDNAILTAFKAGELDLADSIPSDELANLRSAPEYKRYGQIGLYYLEIQLIDGGTKALQDVNVRKALSMAIDRDYINKMVWADSRIPAYSLIPYGIPDATTGSDFRETADNVVGGGFSTDYSANVAKAKELLAAAGYANGVGFPKLEFSVNENTGHQAIATAIIQMWKETLGIDVEIAIMDWATFQEYRETSSADIARQGWLGDYTDPATFFDIFTSSSYYNDGHYSNPEYDALVYAARSEQDTAKRMDYYHQAEAILMNDMPIIPIAFYADDVLTQTYFSGVGVTGTGLKMFWDASRNPQ